VLRQAQHEEALFVASPNKINLILSLSKDEAAAALRSAPSTRLRARRR
jgi:hypothetical protein